jgi:hypothetical protein
MPTGDQVWASEKLKQIESNVLERLNAGHKPKKEELYGLLSQYVAQKANGDMQEYGSTLAQIFAGGPPNHKTLANAVNEFGLQSGLSKEQLAKAMQDPGIIQRIISWFTDAQTPIHHKLGVALGIPLALVGGGMTLFGKGGMAGMLLAGLGGAAALLPAGILDPLLQWANLGGYLGIEEHKAVPEYGGLAAPATAPAAPAPPAATPLAGPAGVPAGGPIAAPGPTGQPSQAGPEAPPTLDAILAGDPLQAMDHLKSMVKDPTQQAQLMRALKGFMPAGMIASSINSAAAAAADEAGTSPPPPVTSAQVKRIREIVKQLKL